MTNLNTYLDGIFTLLPNGKYDYQSVLKDGDAMYICGVCNKPLTDEEAREFIKLMYIPPGVFPEDDTEESTIPVEEGTKS